MPLRHAELAYYENSRMDSLSAGESGPNFGASKVTSLRSGAGVRNHGGSGNSPSNGPLPARLFPAHSPLAARDPSRQGNHHSRLDRMGDRAGKRSHSSPPLFFGRNGTGLRLSAQAPIEEGRPQEKSCCRSFASSAMDVRSQRAPRETNSLPKAVPF